MITRTSEAASRIVALLNSESAVGGDALRDPDRFRAFCSALEIDQAELKVDETLLAIMRDLRAAVANCIEEPSSKSSQALEQISANAQLVMRVDDKGMPMLSSAAIGSASIPALFVLAVAALSEGGGWSRIRVCDAPECSKAFFDSTRSRTRRWCSMATCGNRAKVSEHRQRQGQKKGQWQGERKVQRQVQTKGQKKGS